MFRIDGVEVYEYDFWNQDSKLTVFRQKHSQIHVTYGWNEKESLWGHQLNDTCFPKSSWNIRSRFILRERKKQEGT